EVIFKDLTARTKFSTSEEGINTINENGLIKIHNCRRIDHPKKRLNAIRLKDGWLTDFPVKTKVWCLVKTKDQSEIDEFLNKPIEEFDLSIKASGLLRTIGVKKLNDLKKLNWVNIVKTNKKLIFEIISIIHENGLIVKTVKNKTVFEVNQDKMFVD